MKLICLLFLASSCLASIGRQNTSHDIAARLIDYGVDVNKVFTKSELDGFQNSSSSCPELCSTLRKIFPYHALSPGGNNFSEWQSSYWSQQQAEVIPACVFQPTDAKQVATGLLLTRLTKCAFAVKSGGHGAWMGASSIRNGLTIDLARMKSLELSAGNEIARLQPGLKWVEVFTALEPEGLMVIGGRDSDIGVGGLTLGGGISYFSNEYGMACDNVESYQIVTGNGQILEVSQKAHPDFYRTLRGGGKNFGIVTRFDLATYKQGLMWGGTRIYNITDKNRLISSFLDLLAPSPERDNRPDYKSHLMLSFGYVEQYKQFFAFANIEYAVPVAVPNAAFLQNTSFDTTVLPPLRDTMAIRTLANVTLDLHEPAPSGFRQTAWTQTFQIDKRLASELTSLFAKTVSPLINRDNGNKTQCLVDNDDTVLPVISFHILTKQAIVRMSRNGGNVLGILPDNYSKSMEDKVTPLMLISITFRWAKSGNDKVVLYNATRFMRDAKSLARMRGLDHRYIYMNYASQFQNVLASYGGVSLGKMREVKKRYDPDNVFGDLQSE